MTASHYENFPVASWLIPPALRPHVAAVYAFARTADDLSDEESDPQRALTRLAQWGESLEACVAGRATHPVFVALGETIRVYDLPVQLFRDLLTAFTRDVTVHRYATWDDLLTNYCRYSANPVGRLVLWLFGYRDAELHRLSDCICTALQLVNFWQDLAIDLHKDRIYLPQDTMARYGVTEAALFDHVVDEGFRRAMTEAADVAERLFREGAALPGRVRGRLRWELRATWLGGTTILRRTRAAGYDTFRHRPALTTADKLMIAMRAFRGKSCAAH
ncbi:MAG: squalene synthase HpnC [Candidatus Omnitrophica bacterium]|nr:squalene synthase HpnC [Candidatus Omnitrophota bacterium]